ncbi:MAG TPA: BMP family ABC transporter substrate-binding protein [Syntrophales bacterium]|nr:BMP family ABC transporter substrate-binding protein [Syntrophales bacterium]
MNRITMACRIFALVAMVLCLITALPGSGMAAREPIKVAFIYVGPVGDAGWSYTHDQGRRYLEKNLAGVKTAYVESVPEGADAERVLTQFARDGYKVIFATSFGYMDAVINVSKKFPDVYFEHCSGFKTGPNVSTYFGRIYEARYLSGIVAGKMTKSNLIGYVAAHPIPEVIRGINAFTQGVRSVNPVAKVRVVWTNTWYNPASEKEAAKALLDAGCDVIAQHQDTPGPMQAAEERGKYGISYNSPMMQFAPKAVLTGPVWNWGPYYAKRVKAAMDGTWKSGQYWGPMADGVVDLAPFNKVVPADVVKLVTAQKREILRGRLHPFAGPVKDNTGKIMVPAGKIMSDQEMLSVNWFVEGVEGTLPRK